MKTRTRTALAACAAGLLAVSTARADVTVWFDPTPRMAQVGDTFTINLVANIPQSQAVIGWGLDYIFPTPGLIAQVQFTIGPAWDPAPSTPDGDGLAGLVHFPPGEGVSGQNVLLATITFQALAEGQTALVASDDYPGDPTEGFAIDPALGGGFATVTYLDGLVIIPEPSASILLALAAAFLRRRR
jgi:hypothetical protein